MVQLARIRNPLIRIGIAISIGACAPATTLEQGWTTPSAQTQPPLRRVVTLYSSPTVVMQRAGEDQLAREFTARGVQATPGYAILGIEERRALASIGTKPQAAAELEAVKAKLRDMGYDGVVTLQIVDREKNLLYDWGTWGYPGYWGYGYWDYGYWPGYGYTETIYRTEATAYSLRTNQLVWSGLIRSVDPNNADQLINDASKVAANALANRGLAG
jgi:hypothetical protein